MNQLFHQRRERLNLFQKLFNRKPTEKQNKPNADIALSVCPKCNAAVRDIELKENLYVCPACDHHYSISAYERLDSVLDAGSFFELNARANSLKLNDFPDYRKKLAAYQAKSGLNEAVVCGTGIISKQKIAIAVMDNRFMMGSMGQIVGEKITRLIETADRRKLPLFIFCASGGARMQEGIISLMQMAKTSAALARFSANGGFYCAILTNPTTGGVSASFAMLGDVILAEPKALIGFAGRRVIEKTVNEQLPEDFQTAEFLLKKGFVDRIVPRSEMRQTLSHLIALHQRVLP